MYTVLVVLILIVCFLLALVVLAQNPKGGGISSQFSAGGAASMMGVKRTGDLLEKLTWGFAIGLVVLALGTHMLTSNGGGPVRSVNQQRALETKLPNTDFARIHRKYIVRLDRIVAIESDAVVLESGPASGPGRAAEIGGDNRGTRTIRHKEVSSWPEQNSLRP